MRIEHNVRADFQRPGVRPVIRVAEGDAGTRFIVIDLYNGGQPYSVGTGVTGVVKYAKTDGHSGVYDTLDEGEDTERAAVVFHDNSRQAVVELATSICKGFGLVAVIVQFIKGTEVLTTFPVDVIVERDPTDGTTAEDFFSFRALEDLYVQMDQMQESLDKIEDAITISAGYTHELYGAENSYWRSTGQTAVLTTLSGRYTAVDPIPAAPGDTFYITSYFGSTANAEPALIVDADYKIVARSGHHSGYSMETIEITAPATAAYLLITPYKQAAAQNERVIVKKSAVVVDVVGVQALATETAAAVAYIKNVYTGKKLSVLGDSISAYAGTIPAGNKVYYTGSNAGVSSPAQMWWRVLCDKLGMQPLVINGWSGSTVTSGVRDAATYMPASDTSRANGLHDGSTDPDVIVIAMGVNDYSYSAPMGTWDGTTALSGDTTTFRSAYATMLARIQSRYPAAAVVCVTPWFVQRGTDAGATYKNSIGLQAHDYANAIREIADIMHCQVIDGMAIGFNRYNFYPTYCVDSASTPTHPNAAGHMVMGETVATELAMRYTGFVGHSGGGS